MRYIFVILLFIQATIQVFGQTQTITGKIVDSEDKMPISNVIVQLLDANEKILTYTFSKDNGTFSISCPSGGVVLLFKSMGYRNHTVSVSENQSPLEIFLVNEPILLRDIVVKAPDILLKNDTLVYNVEKYADAQDRTIADVLKKMPGIEVSESGQIKYNGEPINKFYIEGNDLLEGRYGLASNNISHKDVQNVEIMENHQPVRALQGIEYSEQAGLNIRLKESAKLRWSGVVGGGIGFSPALYDASLFAMRIAGKLQSMETLRLNNTGWNPASQSVSYTYDNLFGTTFQSNRPQNYISVGEHSTPLDERRTRFNQSCLFNTTHSLKLNNVYDIKANITYEKDKVNFERYSRTDYMDSSITPFAESELLNTNANTVSGEIVLQSNQPGAYLKDKLSVDLGWNNAVSNIGGFSEIGQKAQMPVFNAKNELQIAKRIQNQILTISSSNSFASKPHSLSVENGGKTDNQDITSTVFQSQTETGYGWIFGKWQVRGRAGLNYNQSKLESNLTGMEPNAFPTMNHSLLSLTNVYARPEIVYENKHLRLNPYFLVNYYAYFFRDRKADERSTKNYGIISPAFSARYRFSVRMELYADARYSVTPPKTDIFYTGLIMSNYRYLNTGYPLYDSDTRYSTTLSLRYRNPLSSVFANIGGSYEKSNAALTLDQLFVNEQIIMTYRPLPNSSEIYCLNGGISKGIFSGKIHIGMDMVYTQIGTANMRNSNIVPYKLRTMSVMPRIKGTLLKWIAVEYTLSAARNAMNFSDNRPSDSSDNLKQRLNISLSPVKKLQTSITAEHYYTRFNDNTSDQLLLLDAGVRWVASSKVDIGLSATNLMNDKYYRYSRYETLSETTYRYKIRPRNVTVSALVRF